MADRNMLAAATLFAATTTFTTAVSMREQHLPDEPLGFRFPGRVPVHLALGLGSGVAAPWPMPVIALAAAMKAGRGVTWPERTCAIIGAVVLVGRWSNPLRGDCGRNQHGPEQRFRCISCPARHCSSRARAESVQLYDQGARVQRG